MDELFSAFAIAGAVGLVVVGAILLDAPQPGNAIGGLMAFGGAAGFVLILGRKRRG